MILKRTLIKSVILSSLLFITRLTIAQDSRSFVSWSPDGTMIASNNDSVLSILDARTLQVMNVFQNLNVAATAAVWSPDANLLAIPNGAQVDVWQQPWNAASAQLQFSLTYSSGYIYALTWSPDGNKIIVGAANDESVGDVWDVNLHQIVYRLRGHTNQITQFAWSPDGAWIVSSSKDRTIRLWNASDGQLEKTIYIVTNQPLPDDRAIATAVSWDPTSNKVAISAEDGTVRIWDRTTSPLEEQSISPNLPTVWQPYPDNILAQDWVTILSIAWSPDGSHIASGDIKGNVIVWNASTGEPFQIINAGSYWVYSVVWNNSDGKLAYSGSKDVPVITTVRLLPTTNMTPTIGTFPTTSVLDNFTCVNNTVSGNRHHARGDIYSSHQIRKGCYSF